MLALKSLKTPAPSADTFGKGEVGNSGQGESNEVHVLTRFGDSLRDNRIHRVR
jgi:hypothetical protein